MKKVKALVACLSLCTAATSVIAADSSGPIKITYPLELTTLTSSDGNTVNFNYVPTSNGNYVVISVDGMEAVVDRDVGNCPCRVHLPYMNAGKHTLAIMEANSAMSFTGAQDKAMITVIGTGGGDGASGGSD